MENFELDEYAIEFSPEICFAISFRARLRSGCIQLELKRGRCLVYIY